MEQPYDVQESGDEIEPPGKLILAKLNALYEDKVGLVIQKLMESLQERGLSEEAAGEELVHSLLNEPAFVYMIWRLILTDEAYQTTEQELIDAEDAIELLDWLKTFGGGVINEDDVDVLLCTYHPNKYSELLEYLMEQYPHVPQMEFFYLKNKAQKLKDEQSQAISDGDGDLQVGEITMGKSSKIPPPLQPITTKSSLQASPKYRKKNGRTKWLYDNARIARLYQKEFRKTGIIPMIEEVGISPWFRIFFSIWLLAATVLAVVVGWHCMFVLLTRMFLPIDSNYLTGLATFSCFILSINFAGTYFTALDRILNGWIFMDDETYYGDQDFSVIYNEKVKDEGLDELGTVSNPPEVTQCPHLLPPVAERTFLGLPGGKKGWIRRELWITIPVLTSTVLPFLYSLIWTATEGKNVYEVLGVFVEWNILNALFLTFAYWLYMWYYSMRKKYSAWCRNKESDVKWNVDLEFLQEWGIDERSVRRNIAVTVLSSVPLMIMFWIVSYKDLHITTMWIITAASVAVLFMLLREAWMSDSWKEKIPYVIGVLLAVFFLVGLIGSIVSGRGIIVVFLLLAVMTQMLTVRHRQIANVDELVWLFEFLKTVYERVLVTEDDAPLSTRGAEPKTPGALQRDVRKKLNKTLQKERRRAAETDPSREGSMFPCMNILTALFSFPWCIKKCSSRTEETGPIEDPDEVKRGHWRLGKRWWGDDAIPPTSETKGKYEPTDKLVQSVSPKLAGWFMLVFFIWCLVAFSLAHLLNQPASGSFNLESIGKASTMNSYPVCQMTFLSDTLNIVDLAKINRAAYLGRVNNVLSGKLYTSAQSGDGYKLLSKDNLRVFVVSSPLENGYMMRDLDVWGDSLAFSVASSAVPFLRFFGDDVTQRFVDGLRFLKSALDPSDVDSKDKLYHLTEAVISAKSGGNTVLVTGHGTNGGIAKIVAARAQVPVVTFNAPGTHWLEKRYMQTSNIRNELNVVAYNDVSAQVDVQTGAQQMIRCESSHTMAECYGIEHTLCELEKGCFGTAPAECN
eukprot:TRINITY_DN3262_c0_g1_i1.p1 TRINITY_DN3262_c0_g1~~TRINITY_DN3262_c0_g1_i1.p1  ORF type:complete len:1022 (+),score=365.69 TRINITY_DN3262_c0_g1_i1:35-3100(+)